MATLRKFLVDVVHGLFPAYERELVQRLAKERGLTGDRPRRRSAKRAPPASWSEERAGMGPACS